MPAARTIDEATLVSASMWLVGQYRGLLDDTCVPTSELHASSETVKEAVHLRGVLDTLAESVATTLLTDSQSCLALATRDDNSAKTKHFLTRMTYVRETVKNQSSDLKFIASGDNCADISTKGQSKTKTQQHFACVSRFAIRLARQLLLSRIFWKKKKISINIGDVAVQMTLCH